ncbi:MAG: hypothetical protein ACKE5M_04330 [Methylophilaceae bacterium]
MNSLISRLFFSLLALSFANSALAEFADIQRLYRKPPNLYQFEICQSGGCAKVSPLILNRSDWHPIDTLFLQPTLSAEQERGKISEAIGIFENIVGHKVDTFSDRAGTFGNSDYSGQQDCNDEAINTTTYMRMLKQAGYIQFHEIEDMRTRNFFFDGWPHTTAVIHEVDTGERYAVDSWFYDNGHAATIIPFQVWKEDYFPEDSPLVKSRKD